MLSGSWAFCALQKAAPGEIFKIKDDTVPRICIQWKIPGASSLRLQNHKDMHACVCMYIYIYIYICFFAWISSELFLFLLVMLTSIQAVLFSAVFAGEPFFFLLLFIDSVLLERECVALGKTRKFWGFIFLLLQPVACSLPSWVWAVSAATAVHF